MNVPAILSISKAFRNPALCLPHRTVPTFDQLPVPLSRAFDTPQANEKSVKIRGVVLDKDNCFAAPESDEVHEPCKSTIEALKDTYSPNNVIVVSNSSGLASRDPNDTRAQILQSNSGLRVLRHTARKPACGNDILAYFGKRGIHASELVIIGDRLFTDVMMANLIGSRSIWIKRGVVENTGLVTRLEYTLADILTRRGYTPP